MPIFVRGNGGGTPSPRRGGVFGLEKGLAPAPAVFGFFRDGGVGKTHPGGNGIAPRRHSSQAAPCSPGRAALYTGTYQMNNRVVANGTPLDTRLDNIALAARRAGYVPALFGYTDQGVDPRFVTDPADPRLSTYEGVLPGFDPVLDMSGWQLPWLQWLNSHGYDFPDPISALEREHERPVALSTSRFLTDAFLAWLGDH